ncbi:hypothetical protein QYE76_001076 [Lolium multiflorum]|uniref:Uncharacterized protein n=1 Tax=Lolium multiflorum TaxID=4521 RepID=A0AAD8VZC3_LOLMU|nr:hypothetical protein QYE76_001076 [Lolium multiflorum]
MICMLVYLTRSNASVPGVLILRLWTLRLMPRLVVALAAVPLDPLVVLLSRLSNLAVVSRPSRSPHRADVAALGCAPRAAPSWVCTACGAKAPCQLCGIAGHLASRYHRRFKQDFLGIGNDGRGNDKIESPGTFFLEDGITMVSTCLMPQPPHKLSLAFVLLLHSGTPALVIPPPPLLVGAGLLHIAPGWAVVRCRAVAPDFSCTGYRWAVAPGVTSARAVPVAVACTSIRWGVASGVTSLCAAYLSEWADRSCLVASHTGASLDYCTRGFSSSHAQ